MTTEDATGDARLPAEPSPGVPAAGWWPSPWSAAQVAAGKVSRGTLQYDRGHVYWCESRPDEGGRQVVVAVDPSDPTGRPVDVSPEGVSVRTRVHEYGGGAMTVVDGTLHYVDLVDQAWYRVAVGSADAPEGLGSRADPDAGTDTGASVRHADGRVSPDGRWLWSVEERVGPDGTTHRLVALALDGSGGTVATVVDGDFVAAPRPSPDGRWLSWLTWDHPDMPWDATRLRVAPLVVGDGPPTVGTPRTLAGGPGVSVGQPRWGADGSLLFLDDRSGWWLPYRLPAASFAGDDPDAGQAVALVDDRAEYHVPDWVLGIHTVDQLDDGSLVAVRSVDGRDGLVVLQPSTDGADAPGWSWTPVEQPCLRISGVVGTGPGTVAVVGSTSTEASVVVAVALDGSEPPRRLSAPPAVAVPPERASCSVPYTGRPGGTGHAGSASAPSVPGRFFPAVNPDVVPDGTPPPLVVFCHGGPTSSAEPGYDPVIQFLTSRGIAVAAVDYRGSSGHGRAYRNLLRGSWGQADVDDCVAYAESLARDGLVDGARMAIRGTSAGGLTALAALIRARCFVGAVAWYGVTDLLALAADTHDFESRYMDSLVGPLPGAQEAYRSRSPIHHADRLVGRVLLLQGSDDPIVPASQAEQFAEELRTGGADCTLVVFDGESHGFRRSDTIEAALTAELDFYRSLFADGGDRGR